MVIIWFTEECEKTVSIFLCKSQRSAQTVTNIKYLHVILYPVYLNRLTMYIPIKEYQINTQPCLCKIKLLIETKILVDQYFSQIYCTPIRC